MVWLALAIGCTPPQKTTTNLAPADYPTRVAVLPFEIVLTHRPVRAEGFDDQQMQELRQYMSIALQGLLYNKMKPKMGQNGIVTSLLSVDMTNAQLAAQKISFASLFSGSKRELCQLLGVDAVISGRLVLAEAPRESLREMSNPFWSVRMQTNLYNSTLEQAVWSYQVIHSSSRADQIKNTVFPKANDYPTILRGFEPQIEKLLKKVVKEYPFKKKAD
jgi:hypothetical protein